MMAAIWKDLIKKRQWKQASMIAARTDLTPALADLVDSCSNATVLAGRMASLMDEGKDKALARLTPAAPVGMWQAAVNKGLAETPAFTDQLAAALNHKASAGLLQLMVLHGKADRVSSADFSSWAKVAFEQSWSVASGDRFLPWIAGLSGPAVREAIAGVVDGSYPLPKALHATSACWLGAPGLVIDETVIQFALKLINYPQNALVFPVESTSVARAVVTAVQSSADAAPLVEVVRQLAKRGAAEHSHFQTSRFHTTSWTEVETLCDSPSTSSRRTFASNGYYSRMNVPVVFLDSLHESSDTPWMMTLPASPDKVAISHARVCDGEGPRSTRWLQVIDGFLSQDGVSSVAWRRFGRAMEPVTDPTILATWVALLEHGMKIVDFETQLPTHMESTTELHRTLVCLAHGLVNSSTLTHEQQAQAISVILSDMANVPADVTWSKVADDLLVSAFTRICERYVSLVESSASAYGYNGVAQVLSSVLLDSRSVSLGLVSQVPWKLVSESLSTAFSTTGYRYTSLTDNARSVVLGHVCNEVARFADDEHVWSTLDGLTGTFAGNVGDLLEVLQIA